MEKKSTHMENFIKGYRDTKEGYIGVSDAWGNAIDTSHSSLDSWIEGQKKYEKDQKNGITTVWHTPEEIFNGVDCPLPLEVIPNQMGINLVSVEYISWERQDDGQLVNLTINFLPEWK